MFFPKTVLLAALAAASTVLASVNNATFDGTCYYPVGDSSFEIDPFLGRWYQVAGTAFLFTLGCSCTFAEYDLNTDGTLNVTNTCQLGVLKNSISGTIKTVDEAYGSGALQVSFDVVPGGGVLCPGPNYIVQKYTDDWAIVQSPLWSELFLLSRNQNVTDAEIDKWLAIAETLGTNLTLVSKISQKNCLYT